MSFLATRKVVSVFTAYFLLASLVLSVQVSFAAPATIADMSEMPCDGHEQPTESDRSPTDCASHCVSGSLEHLTNHTFDRTSPPVLKALPLAQSAHPYSGFRPIRLAVANLDRGPPSTNLYLITQRVRL